MIPGLDSILGGGGLTLGSAATGHFGPVTSGPVVVNVAGFGSKANGSATNAITPEPDQLTQGAGISAPTQAGNSSWLMLAALGAVLAWAVLGK